MRLRTWVLLVLAAAAGAGWWRWPVPPADAVFTPRLDRGTFVANQGPAVLVDDAHWNTATTRRGLVGFADLLRADGYRILPDGNATRAEMLADARIAVLANPLGLSGLLQGLAGNLGLPPLAVLEDDALWVQEMETVLQWVENGGALLVAVDEGPVVRAVRGLTTRLGIQVGGGVVVDLGHSEPRAPERLVFSRENGLIGEHPIVDGGPNLLAVNRLVSVGGPSLSGPPGAAVLLRLSSSAVEVPRLGVSPSAGTPVPGLARAVAFTRGRGRVVVVADTSLLTSLAGEDGRRYGLGAEGTQADRFVVGTMRWLARQDEPPRVASR